MKNLFIHKFNTTRNRYIYDVNTNNVIKAEQIIYDIIDDYDVILFSGIISKWKEKYKEKLVTDALKCIDKFHKSGKISFNRPTTMKYPMCEDHLHEALQSKLDGLTLNITEKCNLRCKYCSYSGTYYYERKHSLRNMSWAIAKKAIDYFCPRTMPHDVRDIFGKVVSKGNPNISFYGGECLINFNLIKKSVKYIKSINQSINFRIDTNGTILNEEIIKFLIDNDVTLQVSLDGPLEEHDKFRVFKNGKSSFNLIVKNLQKLQQMDRAYYKRRVCFISTLSAANNLLNIYKFFSSNELVKDQLVIVNYVSSYDTDFFKIISKQMGLQWEGYYDLLNQYIDLRVANDPVYPFLSGLFEKSLLKVHLRQLKPMGMNCGPNGMCAPGTRRLFVDVEGRFYPCEKVGRAFCIGDVDKGIEYQKVESIIEKYIKGSKDCMNCWAVRLCGLCLPSARKGDKFDLRRKKENCLDERSNLHDSLVLYAEIMEQNPKAFDFVKEMSIG